MGYKITNDWIYKNTCSMNGYSFRTSNIWMGMMKKFMNGLFQTQEEPPDPILLWYIIQIVSYKDIKNIWSPFNLQFYHVYIAENNLIQQFNVTVVVNSIPYLKQNRSRHVQMYIHVYQEQSARHEYEVYVAMGIWRQEFTIMI